LASSGAFAALEEIKREFHDLPRDLEDIRDRLHALCERRANPGWGGEGRDQEELTKCNAIIEQKIQTFQVIPGLFPIVIVFSLKF
jgi:hypothetical protein